MGVVMGRRTTGGGQQQVVLVLTVGGQLSGTGRREEEDGDRRWSRYRWLGAVTTGLKCRSSATAKKVQLPHKALTWHLIIHVPSMLHR